MLRKKLAAFLAVAMVAATVVGCGGGDDTKTDAPATTDDASTDDASTDDASTDDASTDDASTDDASTDDTASSSSGELITLGVINNDPSESGYRTANVANIRGKFTKENGYDATFFESLKNEEQITQAQKFIADGVDYLILSAADTSGWDTVLQDAQAAGVRVILFDRIVDADEGLYEAGIVSDMDAEGQRAVDWLAEQNLDQYNIIHIQGTMGSSPQVGRSGALQTKVDAESNWNIVSQQTAEWNAEKAQQVVQAAIDAKEEFNVIYAENDDMAKGAVAALDAANISHGKDGDVIIMGFDCNKWALKEVLEGRWNFDGQCNPFQADAIHDVIQQLEAGNTLSEKLIYMDEGIFTTDTITQDDIDKFGIGEE